MGTGRGASTQALIGDYSAQFLGAGPGARASLRTPLQENIIMQEARNQRAFRDMTPLAGDHMVKGGWGKGVGVVSKNDFVMCCVMKCSLVWYSMVCCSVVERM